MSTIAVPDGLRDHPDRIRWNTRYEATEPSFVPHPLVTAALRQGLPAGPVLELACGTSGSALALAASGRRVVAVDVSDVALGLLAVEAHRRGLDDRITCAMADVPSFDPGSGRFALVLATYYWDPDAFGSACRAVAPGGLLGWEALCRSAGGRDAHPEWRVEAGELSHRLPSGFDVLAEQAHAGERGRSTRLLARRVPDPGRSPVSLPFADGLPSVTPKGEP